MKYQSEIIHEILEQRGHEKSSLHYQSECIETWIEETKGAYPKLCDYESEWLNYIIENPIGEFPYVTLTNVTEATVDNVVPYAYKSAILKGSTKYRDIDTGEILESFEDGRNLELVSVKMPVLKTTGKNLFDKNNHGWDLEIGYVSSNGQISDFYKHTIYTQILDVPKNIQIVSVASNLRPIITYYDKNDVVVKQTTDGIIDTSYERMRLSFRTVDNSEISEEILLNSNIQIEYGTVATSYEPFKSNILTVNEDVTLRSNGNVYDELDLLTGKLTQRIDEDGSVLTQEDVKTVELTITDESGNEINHFMPIEGVMHIQTDGEPVKPSVTMEIPVEAITQNLSSFIEGE